MRRRRATPCRMRRCPCCLNPHRAADLHREGTAWPDWSAQPLQLRGCPTCLYTNELSHFTPFWSANA